MESDEKDENKQETRNDLSIKKERSNIVQFDEQFKKYLNNKNNTNDKSSFNQIEKDFKTLKKK